MIAMLVRILLMLLFAACLAILLPSAVAYSQESAPVEPTPQVASDAEADIASSEQHLARAAKLRTEIRAILDRPEFKFAGRGESRPIPKWLQWLRRTWDNMWKRFQETGERVGEDAPWLMFVLLAIAAAVMLVLIWRVISESFLERRGDPAGRRDRDELTPAMLFEQAATAGARGDFPEAVRLLFKAAVLSLFGQAAATTPAVMLRAKLMAMESGPVSEFTGLKRYFDSSFYGGAMVSRTDYENARNYALALRRVNEEEPDEK